MRFFIGFRLIFSSFCVCVRMCTFFNLPCKITAFLERLFDLNFTPDLKWDSYIQSLAKDVIKMVGTLCRYRNYLIPPTMFYL